MLTSATGLLVLLWELTDAIVSLKDVRTRPWARTPPDLPLLAGSPADRTEIPCRRDMLGHAARHAGRAANVNSTGVVGSSRITRPVPQRVFLSHTSDLGKANEPETFVAAAVAAVLRARHAVTDMAYFAARDTSPAALCVGTVAQADVYVGIIGLRYGSPVNDRT
jgi:Domain of unknown function (DUF4062)